MAEGLINLEYITIISIINNRVSNYIKQKLTWQKRQTQSRDANDASVCCKQLVDPSDGVRW